MRRVTPRSLFSIAFASLALIVTLVACPAPAQEWKSGIDWKEPPVVNAGRARKAPSDAIVLFDGTDLSAWEGGDKWTIENGYAIDGGDLTSREKFGDCQLHLEFATPEKVEGEGQGRGNSGVYFMSRYELQILDSYKNPTYFDGQCAAIYKQRPPLVNASRKPGRWQTYDVVFTAPLFNDDGTVKTPAYITVLHNGVLVQNHLELKGATFFEKAPEYSRHGEREPLQIQYHRNPMRFRNIWIRDLMVKE